MDLITGIVENIIRRISFRMGWEVRDKIENVVWGILITVILLCCCIFAALAVAFKVMFPS